jgi:hypothetical protein
VRTKVSLPASLPAFKVVLIYAVLCCIWSIALCGAETWMLWKVDRSSLKVLKCAGEGWRISFEK